MCWENNDAIIPGNFAFSANVIVIPQESSFVLIIGDT
jgi:hypothetical protein